MALESTVQGCTLRDLHDKKQVEHGVQEHGEEPDIQDNDITRPLVANSDPAHGELDHIPDNCVPERNQKTENEILPEAGGFARNGRVEDVVHGIREVEHD